MYEIVYSKQALKHVSLLKSANLSNKAKFLIDIISENPLKNPPPYEKLVNDLKGMYSRRINAKHRLVYQVFEQMKIIKIVSLWTHYEF